MKKVIAIILSVIMILGMSVSAFADTNAVDDSADGGFRATGTNTYEIYTANGFLTFYKAFCKGNSFKGCTINLTCDIDLGPLEESLVDSSFGAHIGNSQTLADHKYFEGTFDGKNHTIYSPCVSYYPASVGLFVNLKNATIRNVNIYGYHTWKNNTYKNSQFDVDDGAVAGEVHGTCTIENVTSSPYNGYSMIYGHKNTGGFVGHVYKDAKLYITNCTNNMNIRSGAENIGGFVGLVDEGAYLCVKNSTNNGKISYENYYIGHGKNVGGIAGTVYGSVYFSNVENTGEVNSEMEAEAGGMIGILDWDGNTKNGKPSFNNCTNRGDVIAYAAAGGMIGWVGNDSDDQNYEFVSCKNYGAIKSTDNIAGGIIGHLDTDGSGQVFRNDENYGQVTAADDAGGIIGYTEAGGTFNFCKNSGFVYGGNKAGGVVGELEDDNCSFTNCSNTSWVIGEYHTGGIAGDLGNDDDDPTFSVCNCNNSGFVISQQSDAGGIVGLLDTDSDSNKLQYNTNSGSVSGYRMAGGICGYTLGDADFYASKSEGNVSSYGDAGCHAAGILGDSENSFNVSNLMKSCTVHGTISSSSGSAHKLYGPNGGDTNSLTASTFASGNVWMIVSLAEILVFGIVIVALIAKQKKKETKISTDAK